MITDGIMINYKNKVPKSYKEEGPGKLMWLFSA